MINEEERRMLHAVLSVIEEAVHRAPIDGPFYVADPTSIRSILDAGAGQAMEESVKVHALPWDNEAISRLLRVIRDEARKRYGYAYHYEADRIKELEAENQRLWFENKELRIRSGVEQK